jgi:tetratricopeptide (TPR) repeat protein
MSALIDELQRSCGFAADDAVAQKMQKLQREFAVLGALADEATTLGCALLGLPCEAPPEISQLSPQRRKERTFASFMARIEAMVSRQRVLVIVEDVHWVDPTSLEFLALLVERASAMPLLLLVVGRPEFVPPWPEHWYLTTLVVPRLSRSNSALLIHKVTGERRISVSTEAEIVSRAEGVPLFVEELTRSVLENEGSGDTGGPPRVCSPNAAAPVPATLQGLLLTRLDRLGSAKEVAQAGAVIGREFSFELLHMIAGMDEPALLGALNQLVASGLLFRRGAPPETTFVFKHELVRDAVYGLLLRQRRRTLHASAARALEEEFPEIAKSQPELLAYHFRAANHQIKGISYLLVAAERALLRSASVEALSHLAMARELTEALPKSNERLQLELKLEIATARAFLATRGYTALNTREAYGRARQCCEALGDEAALPLIIHGQWLGAWVAAEHRSALEQARQLCLWGERNNEPVGLAEGHSDFGMTLTTLGQLVEARCHLVEALQINKFVLPGHQPFVASDVDGRISTLSFMHNCLLLLGFPDQAEAAANEAAALSLNNLYSRALAQLRLLRMRVLARDARATCEDGLELLRLARQQGYPFVVAVASIYTGWALAQRGEIAVGIESCQKGLTQLQTMGAKWWKPFHLALLAECYEKAGQAAASAQALAEALQTVEATDERFWEAEIYRLNGKLLENRGDVNAAETCFTTALQKAKAQHAKLLELRAACSLAEQLKRNSRPKRARDVLAPVYSSFTEGFDFTDLRDAKALLDTL